MKTIQRKEPGEGLKSPVSRKEWEAPPMAPERYQRAEETLKGMLSECEDCMGAGLLEQASDLSLAAFQMAQRHGREKLQEDAMIRFVILNIEMDRPEELERAIACGWVAADDVGYISGLFAEAENAEQPVLEEPQKSRAGPGQTITEMKNEILELLEGFKARQGEAENYFSFSEDEL